MTELEQLHVTEPRRQEIQQEVDVGLARYDPVVEILPVRLADRTADPPQAIQSCLKANERNGNAVVVGLVDLRTNAARVLFRGPPLAIEESRCPCELVPIHARVKTTTEVLLSVLVRHTFVRRPRLFRGTAIQSSMSFLPANPASRSCQ